MSLNKIKDEIVGINQKLHSQEPFVLTLNSNGDYRLSRLPVKEDAAQSRIVAPGISNNQGFPESLDAPGIYRENEAPFVARRNVDEY